MTSKKEDSKSKKSPDNTDDDGYQRLSLNTTYVSDNYYNEYNPFDIIADDITHKDIETDISKDQILNKYSGNLFDIGDEIIHMKKTYFVTKILTNVCVVSDVDNNTIHIEKSELKHYLSNHETQQLKCKILALIKKYGKDNVSNILLKFPCYVIEQLKFKPNEF